MSNAVVHVLHFYHVETDLTIIIKHLTTHISLSLQRGYDYIFLLEVGYTKERRFEERRF